MSSCSPSSCFRDIAVSDESDAPIPDGHARFSFYAFKDTIPGIWHTGVLLHVKSSIDAVDHYKYEVTEKASLGFRATQTRLVRVSDPGAMSAKVLISQAIRQVDFIDQVHLHLQSEIWYNLFAITLPFEPQRQNCRGHALDAIEIIRTKLNLPVNPQAIIMIQEQQQADLPVMGVAAIVASGVVLSVVGGPLAAMAWPHISHFFNQQEKQNKDERA